MPIAKATHPVDLADDQPDPAAAVRGVLIPRQPEPRIGMRSQVAGHQARLLGLADGDLLQIADHAQAGQVGGRPRPAARQERVGVPPRQGEGDVVVVGRVVVGADARVARRGARVEEEQRRVADRGFVAVGKVVRQRDGERRHRRRRWRPGPGPALVARGEDAGDHPRAGEGEQPSAEDRGFISGGHAGVGLEICGERKRRLRVERGGKGAREEGEWAEKMAELHCVCVDEIGREKVKYSLLCWV